MEPIADVTNTDPIDDSIGLGFEMDLATEADEALDEIEADGQYETEVDTDLEDEKFADDAVEVTTEDELEDKPSLPAPPPTTASQPTNRITRVDLPKTSSVQPSFYWTWQLLIDGYSVEHIGQTRGCLLYTSPSPRDS